MDKAVRELFEEVFKDEDFSGYRWSRNSYFTIFNAGYKAGSSNLHTLQEENAEAFHTIEYVSKCNDELKAENERAINLLSSTWEMMSEYYVESDFEGSFSHREKMDEIKAFINKENT